jgi:hypothetical protein
MKNLLQKFCRGWEIGGLNEPYSRLSHWDLCGLECVDTPYRDKPIGFLRTGNTNLGRSDRQLASPRPRSLAQRDWSGKMDRSRNLAFIGRLCKAKIFSPELPLPAKLAAICTSN